jgi:hypothetical protein
VEANDMISTYSHQKERCLQRITHKTLDGTFLHLIEKGANCSPFVSNAILHTAKNVYRLNEADPKNTIKPGQMKIVGIAAFEPAGKRLGECQKKECTITVYADSEDDQTRALYGTTGLRRSKLLRIATEAWEQNVLLSHEDFAYKILHCGLRTIARDVKYFKERNIFVPTRGQQMDIGPAVSHKVLAIEQLILRKDEHEIAKTIYHSLSAVERYTLGFARVIILKEKGFNIDETSFVVQLSQRLVKEYLTLYEKYRNNPDCKERLDEILGKARDFDSLVSSASSNGKKNRKELNP